MKPILLCLYFLLMVAGGLLAQPNFAPPGAHWFNNGTDAYYHSYTDGDTVISGRTCTRIRRITHQSPMSWASDFPTLCTYNSGDTVFVYNKLFSQFTPLYIFNVNEGDTIRIPRFDVGYPTLPATYFSYRVDSVRIVTYDTANLKTIFTYSLNEDSVMGGSDPMPTFGGAGTLHGAYAERIGGVGGGIFPSCVGCAVIPEDCGCIGPMRCYSDPGMDIKLATPCAPPLAVAPPQRQRVVLYPNPAHDFLHIDTEPLSNISISSCQGAMIYQSPQTANSGRLSIDLSGFPSGNYFVRITTATTSNYAQLQISH